MTPAVVSLPAAGPGLLDDYLGHLRALGLGDRAVRDRVRIARDFTGRHPGLQEWMTLPVTDRAGELKRTGAWPLVCYAIGTGRLQQDAGLIGARNLAGLAGAVETRDPEAFAAARAAGLHLGWKTSWTETVLGECLAVMLAWHGGQVADLTSEIVDAFDTELATSMMIPPSSRRAYRSRLAGVRQLLFETRVIDTRPGAGPGPALWNSGSMMLRWPRRSAGYCCDTSRPGLRCCVPGRWRAWSTTCSRSPST